MVHSALSDREAEPKKLKLFQKPPQKPLIFAPVVWKRQRPQRVQEVIRVQKLLLSWVGQLPGHFFYYVSVQSERGG